jgi:hypothetical protein
MRLKKTAAGQKLMVQFSGDVSATLSEADLVLVRNTGETVNADDMDMTYDRKRNVATWTFNGLIGQTLPTGTYSMKIRSSGVANAAGIHLDGNRDGKAGDDFAPAKPLKSRWSA